MCSGNTLCHAHPSAGRIDKNSMAPTSTPFSGAFGQSSSNVFINLLSDRHKSFWTQVADYWLLRSQLVSMSTRKMRAGKMSVLLGGQTNHGLDYSILIGRVNCELLTDYTSEISPRDQDTKTRCLWPPRLPLTFCSVPTAYCRLPHRLRDGSIPLHQQNARQFAEIN